MHAAPREIPLGCEMRGRPSRHFPIVCLLLGPGLLLPQGPCLAGGLPGCPLLRARQRRQPPSTPPCSFHPLHGVGRGSRYGPGHSVCTAAVVTVQGSTIGVSCGAACAVPACCLLEHPKALALFVLPFPCLPPSFPLCAHVCCWCCPVNPSNVDHQALLSGLRTPYGLIDITASSSGLQWTWTS